MHITTMIIQIENHLQMIFQNNHEMVQLLFMEMEMEMEMVTTKKLKMQKKHTKNG